MTNRKIVIDTCDHCPLWERQMFPVIIDGTNVYDTCRHPHCEGMNITRAVKDGILHKDCPLMDDESQMIDDEECGNICEECGKIDRLVQYREHTGEYGTYLCDECYSVNLHKSLTDRNVKDKIMDMPNP